jgi:hypothetical protein
MSKSIFAAALAFALASSTGMAYADRIDTGVEPSPAAAPAAQPEGFLLKATVMKDGVEVEHHYFGREGETFLFASKDKCEQFQTLPFFPQILAQLDAFVERTQPGATSVLSCEPHPAK